MESGSRRQDTKSRKTRLKVAKKPAARKPGRQPTELRALLQSVLPSEVQLEAVQTCLEHVQILARQLLGETAVVVQGSYAQGLALQSSDLDIAVIRPKADRSGAKQCLQLLAQALQEAKLPEIRVALKIFSAKVPVLRLHCGKKVVDVSVGDSLLRGACDRAVYALLQRDRSNTAVPLCRLVKLWAKRRKLTNTLKGGLSSFGFVLLTIFFLQQRRLLPSQASVTSRPQPADPEQCCPPPLGLQVRASEPELAQLLADFFTWADGLPAKTSISIASATLRAGPKPLVLEVPFAPEENAARCLRPDVWRLMQEELSQAKGLAEQMAQGQPLLNSLFSQEPEPRKRKRKPREPEPLPKLRKRRKQTAKPPKVAAPVAPVKRWLGLRSLLDPR